MANTEKLTIAKLTRYLNLFDPQSEIVNINDPISHFAVIQPDGHTELICLKHLDENGSITCWCGCS